MSDELEHAKAQAAALAEQVKLLVRTEQRLSQAQRALEEQVRRIEIVNQLSLAVASADDVEQVLDRALEALLAAFPFEQAMAFVPGADAFSPCLARTPAGRTPISRRTSVPLDAKPSCPHTCDVRSDECLAWLAAIDEALPEVPLDDRAPRRILLLPVSDGAMLAACTFGAPTSHTRPLPQDADAPFLELFARHVAAALEALALRHRTVDSETLFQTAFADATTGMALIDDHGRFARVNGALCSMLGVAEEQLLGKAVRDITHPGDRARTEEAKRSTREEPSRRSFEIEKRYLRADGTSFWARTTGSRIAPTSARPEYWFVQIVDVTVRRNLEETERLATVGRLAAGVAHEINNPLTYVLFELEALGRVGLPPKAAQSLDHALSGSKRIARIVRDLKTFARTGAEESLEAVDLTRVVEVVLDMCSAEVRHRAHIALELTPGTMVRATEARVAQVLMNLVINAVHAIGDGHAPGSEIEVRTFSDDEFAYVTVRDTGVGIPPEDLRRIFEPFFTTKGPGVGSGLGLSISSAIVESYGGTLSVTSEVGKGSTFTVRLPRYRAEPGSARMAAAPPMSTPALARARVLIIDDEPMVLRALELTLEECEVFTADGAAKARSLIANERRFDVVICDLMMPGESGSDFYAWLRDSQPELARRTIFITGGAFTPRAKALVATVPNAVLEKPFDFVRLRALIASLRAQP